MNRPPNTKLLDALANKNTSSPPIWLMRQAGRSLPPYRALRNPYGLKKQFLNAESVAQITQMPVDLLGVDGAILYSDILIVCELLGLRWDFVPNRGPLVEQITSRDQIKALPLIRPEEALPFLQQGIHLALETLSVPLLGFIGSPWTITCYLLEGSSKKNFPTLNQWLYHDPEGLHLLLKRVTEALLLLARFQIESGVAALQIFESWGHLLSLNLFKKFPLPYLQVLVTQLKEALPLILFARQSSMTAPLLAPLQPTALSVDGTADLTTLRKSYSNLVLQGNLDPELLLAPLPTLHQAVDDLLASMEKDPGYIVNLGHGVLPQTPFENVQALVDRVKASPLASPLAAKNVSLSALEV